ncbi:MAG: CoA transferase [Planctomycetes bacterium]|nr:CoA transferase [Planctomycetota bacterium]
MRPLKGVHVLELATLLPGPYCGKILRDLGAGVVKVEPPGGDPARRYPPREALFRSINRGKRCLVLDLKSPPDRTKFLEMAARADVVIEGWRPGTARRLGVDYARLRKQNRGLIYVSITGYGQRGPRARRPGHDLTYQAWAGILGVGGSPGGSPAMPAVPIADLAGGALPAAIAVLAALLARKRTGRGRFIDISMAEGTRALGFLRRLGLGTGGRRGGGAIGRLTGRDRRAPLARRTPGNARRAPGDGRSGTAKEGHGALPPDDPLSGRYPCYRLYATRDGHLALGALEPKFWEGFCRAIEAPDLVACAFGGKAVVRRIEKVLRRSDTREWMRRLDRCGACAEPVYGPD